MVKIVKDTVLSLMPRILGMLDRKSDSETYGCFDRNYWCYKIHDYVNIRFQEATHILALLYKHNFEGNIYYNNKKIREWLQAGVDFFFANQLKDGSYNEVYPYEHSFGATVFSTAAITNAIICCNLKFDKKKLLKTGMWLAKNYNEFASNQNWIAALSLYNIYKLTEDDNMKEAFNEKVTRLKNQQASSGIFLEYDGFDFGYSTITLSYLAQLYKSTGNEDFREMALKLIEYIEPKVNELGQVDYSKTSRGTQYLYPYGFYIFKSKIINKILNGLKRNEVINPTWMDDRFMIPFCLDYLMTHIESVGNKK